MPSTRTSDNAEIAVLQIQMEEVKAAQVRAESKIDQILTKLENDAAKFATHEDLKELRIELIKRVWVERVSTVIITAVVTGLIYNFFAAKFG